MRTRVLSVLCALVLGISLLPVPADAAAEIAAKATKSNGNPYYIMVNRRQSTVTVYALDDHGFYTVPVRAMICSAGAAKTATPKGSFSLGHRYRWRLMMGDVYAQYATQFYQDCLFHSVCYAKPNSGALIPSYYNNLGQPASHGCIRLQTEDAKWIFENCGEGTLVTVYDDDEPGELGKPERMVKSVPGKSGWDPTDPEPGNPWAEQRTTRISLSSHSLRLIPGEQAVLSVSRAPEETHYPTVTFRTDAPSVAVVDARGQLRATGVGKTTVTVTCGELTERCTVVVTDPALPFCDVPSQAWFYPDVRYLYETGVISGGSADSYAPNDPLTRIEALQLLYNLAGKPEVEHSEDAARAWYADAVDWALASGIAEDAEGEAPAPSKAELLELLFRYDATRSETEPELSPVAWALETGLLLGDGTGELSLNAELTRAQTAALLHRYCLLYAS